MERLFAKHPDPLFNGFFGNDHQAPAPLAADNIDVHRLPDGPVRKEAMKVIHALNIRAVDGDRSLASLTYLSVCFIELSID